jgi:hypothetical protein
MTKIFVAETDGMNVALRTNVKFGHYKKRNFMI